MSFFVYEWLDYALTILWPWRLIRAYLQKMETNLPDFVDST